MADAPPASARPGGSGDALRALLASSIAPRTREPALGSDDLFATLGLAKFRDAAMGLKGSRLWAKVQPAAPPVLHDPPGPFADWQLHTLPDGGAHVHAPPPAALQPHPNVLAAALALPPGPHVLPEVGAAAPEGGGVNGACGCACGHAHALARPRSSGPPCGRQRRSRLRAARAAGLACRAHPRLHALPARAGGQGRAHPAEAPISCLWVPALRQRPSATSARPRCALSLGGAPTPPRLRCGRAALRCRPCAGACACAMRLQPTM